MSIRILLSFSLCLFTFLSTAFSQSTYNRSISLGIFEGLMSPPDAKGDFFVVGDTQYNTTLSLIVLRIDSAGQTQAGWRLSTQPTLSNIRPAGVTRLADGRVGVAGNGSTGTLLHGFVCILDSNGQATAADRIDFNGYAEWTNITATPDSGFVVSGTSRTPSNSIICLLARYDKHLNVVWEYQLSYANQNPFPRGVAVLPNGSIILGGDLFPFIGSPMIFLAQLDASGNLAWAKSYYSTNAGSSVTKALQYDGQDKLYMSATNNGKMALLAFDTTGSFLWANSVASPNGRPVSNYGLLAGHGGTWIVHGNREVSSINSEGMSVAFSSSGSLLWATAASYPFEDSRLEDVVPHPDGGYVWLINLFNKKRLVKTDGQGLMALPCGPFPLNVTASPLTLLSIATSFVITPGLTHVPLTVTTTSNAGSNVSDCTVLEKENVRPDVTPQVLPQPMHGSARILLSAGSLADDAELHITDLSGRHLALPVTRLSDGWEIQRGGLPAGIYAYQVLQGGQRIASGKLWVAD